MTKDTNLIITMCIGADLTLDALTNLKAELKNTYQTDKVVIFTNAGFNQIAITNPINNETTLLNNLKEND
jgi:hypothetical protein